jgi:hypothetical protein
VEEATEHGGTRGRWFRERILKVQHDFLEFVHLFRFTGVSNQLQAKEMFDLWRKHLRLKDLFIDLKEELSSATDYLFAKESSEQTEAAMRLNVIAVAGVVLGLAFAFLGMNVLVGSELLPRLFGEPTVWRDLKVFGFVLTLFSAIGLALAYGLLGLRHRGDAAARSIGLVLGLFLLLGIAITIGGAWGATHAPAPPPNLPKVGLL